MEVRGPVRVLAIQVRDEGDLLWVDARGDTRKRRDLGSQQELTRFAWK